jgi:hypothetical protein
MIQNVMLPSQIKRGMCLFPYESGKHQERAFRVTGIEDHRVVWFIYFANTLSNAGPWQDRRIYFPTDLVRVETLSHPVLV